jgi:hypothetical protein
MTLMDNQPEPRDTTRLIDAFLDEEYAAIDPELPLLIRLVSDRRAGRSWHKHGSFKDHLYGVYRMLTLWRQPRDVCFAGLLHSVYSNEYVDLALFDPRDGRAILQERVGAGLEEMVHLFCAMPRNEFVTELASAPTPPREGMVLRGAQGDLFRLSAAQVAAFLVITVADLVEQWYSWQEDTMSGYPTTGDALTGPNWSATLWPGPFRPGSSALSLASRLARHLPALGLPVPPVFDHCTKTMEGADEAAAAALYWQAATLQGPHVSPGVTRALLNEVVRLNPYVAEPHLLAAQLALVESDFDSAAVHAAHGHRLLSAWGVQWDKRVSWNGWIIWARLLAQYAREQTWPQTLRRHNNLGLIKVST